MEAVDFEVRFVRDVMRSGSGGLYEIQPGDARIGNYISRAAYGCKIGRIELGRGMKSDRIRHSELAIGTNKIGAWMRETVRSSRKTSAQFTVIVSRKSHTKMLKS